MTEAERRAQGYRTPGELLDQAKGNPIVFHKLHMYEQDWFCAPFVKRVIISPPATIILWQDDTKTVCKCSEGDEFDAEKGIAMCFLKKMFGNPSQVRKFFDKWMKENSVECYRPRSGNDYCSEGERR